MSLYGEAVRKNNAVREAVEAERERCCKDVCEWCREGYKPFKGGDGKFYHKASFCDASAIRERSVTRESK